MLTVILEKLEEERPDLFVHAPCGNIQPVQLIIELDTNQGELTLICWIPQTLIEKVIFYNEKGKCYVADYAEGLEEVTLALAELGYMSYQVRHYYKTVRDFKYEVD